jgi:hypothetical protein
VLEPSSRSVLDALAGLHALLAVEVLGRAVLLEVMISASSTSEICNGMGFILRSRKTKVGGIDLEA